MQNWRDNAQSQLPGFRDRIVKIKLGPEEGGLNLNMTRTQIEGADRPRRGGRPTAGELFAEPSAGARRGRRSPRSGTTTASSASGRR